jgi:3-methyladenine DNA glycosylase Tag
MLFRQKDKEYQCAIVDRNFLFETIVLEVAL